MEPDEGHHLVREVFGGLDLGVVSLAGTLGGVGGVIANETRRR